MRKIACVHHTATPFIVYSQIWSEPIEEIIIYHLIPSDCIHIMISWLIRHVFTPHIQTLIDHKDFRELRHCLLHVRELPHLRR
uniref:Uncharacterized protein n=1 Tax=Arundo donax TaxID=35708 RepID=A0A0A9A730_ARUDO